MIVIMWGLQSPINVGMILRSAETFDCTCRFYDRSGVFNSAKNIETISDFSCGAYQRKGLEVLKTPEEALAGLSGRLVATTTDRAAVPVEEMEWQPDDALLVGNEYDGLPADLLARADARIRIPLPDNYLPKPPSASPIAPARGRGVLAGAPSLNVAVATSIFCYLAYLRSSGNRAR